MWGSLGWSFSASTSHLELLPVFDLDFLHFVLLSNLVCVLEGGCFVCARKRGPVCGQWVRRVLGSACRLESVCVVGARRPRLCEGKTLRKQPTRMRTVVAKSSLLLNRLTYSYTHIHTWILKHTGIHKHGKPIVHANRTLSCSSSQWKVVTNAALPGRQLPCCRGKEGSGGRKVNEVRLDNVTASAQVWRQHFYRSCEIGLKASMGRQWPILKAVSDAVYLLYQHLNRIRRLQLRLKWSRSLDVKLVIASDLFCVGYFELFVNRLLCGSVIRGLDLCVTVSGRHISGCFRRCLNHTRYVASLKSTD